MSDHESIVNVVTTLSAIVFVAHFFIVRKLTPFWRSTWLYLAMAPALVGFLVFAMLGMFPTVATVVTYLLGWAAMESLKKLGFFKYKNQAGANGDVLRGTEIVNDDDAIAILKREGVLSECHARIGKVPIPETVETTHFLMSGAPGSGKSLAFIQLLDSARERKHRALVADLGGEFVKRYYQAGDVILNPFDARTVNWSPFAEMRQSFDAARIAASMIPEGSGESKEWNGYARAVLEGILEKLFESGSPTNQDLVYFCLGAQAHELAQLCDGTPAAVYFAQGNERQLGSIRGILASYIKPLTYLRPEAGRDAFSIRSWIENDESQSWLFLNFKKDQLDALRSMIGGQIDIAAASILSRDAELGRRVWFALDEFAQLGEIRQLESLLNLGRKYGVCTILGMQGISQPQLVYGRDRAGAILAGCGTWSVYRQGDAESAEYMSKFLGDEEIRRMVETESTSKDSTSTSSAEQILRQRAVMPSELLQMAPRTAIVNVAGPLPPARTYIPLPPAKPTAAPAFELVAGRVGMPVQPGPARLPVQRPAPALPGLDQANEFEV